MTRTDFVAIAALPGVPLIFVRATPCPLCSCRRPCACDFALVPVPEAKAGAA